MTSPIIVQVAVAAPLRTLFDYLPPIGGDSGALKPGCRVRVSFGRGERIGVIWSISAQSGTLPAHKLKAISEILDEIPLLDDVERQFLSWCADYYHHPLGDVVAAAMPVDLRKGKPPKDSLRKGWRLTPEGSAAELDSIQRAKVQTRVMSYLRDCLSEVAADELRLLEGDIRGALLRLQKRGWIESCEIRDEPGASDIGTNPRVLMDGQQRAVDEVISAVGGFSTFLLDGITASGKTEVYIQAATAVVKAGLQVLVLVPEIALTPQLEGRFRDGIPGRIVASHSGLNDGERQRAWISAQRGEADLLVGTRSAIFTPMPRLGLIIVDEEHDLSFKQQEGFRYSARDMAVMKAKQRDIPVVLGSATPSLESFDNAQAGRYQWLKLRQRAGEALIPHIEVLDIRAQKLHGGLSPQLITEMRETLRRNSQVILFLNRRGYAPQITCDGCGWLAECAHCDARMTFHAASKRLWCHHCGFQRPAPRACPECGAEALVYLGQGTERLEETLGELFPETPLVRIDRDTTRRKGSLEAKLQQIHQGDAAILIGTQMVAKGHDFPNVTLVGILNLDQGLLNPDFRAPERTAQLLMQVAGRAGRAQHPGRVLLQTRHPDHPLLMSLIKNGYEAFATMALAERREVRLPPAERQLLLRAESTKQADVEQFLAAAKDAAKHLMGGVELWGPVPAPMERKAGHFRGHLMLQSASRSALHQQLSAWLDVLQSQPGARAVRWSIDVDPMEFS